MNNITLCEKSVNYVNNYYRLHDLLFVLSGNRGGCSFGDIFIKNRFSQHTLWLGFDDDPKPYFFSNLYECLLYILTSNEY